MGGTGDVLRHHLEALAAGDVEAIVSDYADDAIVISGQHTVRGLDGVRLMFKAVADNPPKIDIDVTTVEGDVGYITWHSDTASFGTDTFVVRDGKIVYQTVAVKR